MYKTKYNICTNTSTKRNITYAQLQVQNEI